MFINMPAFVQLELIFGFGMFFVILGVIIFHSVKNNKKPKLTVNATVVAKRKIGRGRSVSDTHYFVTFQVDSGDRIEFLIPSFDYSEFKQDDYGKLTFLFVCASFYPVYRLINPTGTSLVMLICLYVIVLVLCIYLWCKVRKK